MPPVSDTNDFTSGSVTPEKLIERLKKALQRDGDFPASAKVVNDIRTLTQNPRTTASQLTEIILREPSLGLRILGLINSSFYSRQKEITTISQAVIQIGMKPLADLCSTLVLLQKFVPTARQGGALAHSLRRTIVMSLLSNSIALEIGLTNDKGKGGETAHLLGWFSEMGSILLAFYFPQIYENAVRRAEIKGILFQESLYQIIGMKPLEVSVQVLAALDLPAYYRDVLVNIDAVRQKPINLSSEKSETLRAASAVLAARTLSEIICGNRPEAELDAAVARVRSNVSLTTNALTNIFSALPSGFRDYCATLDLSLPPLPDYLATFKSVDQKVLAEPAEEGDLPMQTALAEIRESIDSHEPTTSIITSVMETLMWTMHFDRVLLLLLTPSKTELAGRIGLGNLGSMDPKKIIRHVGVLANPNAPDQVAVRDTRPIFTGPPIFSDGYPFAAIPIGFGKRIVGILYADKMNSKENELSGRQQASIGILAELLDRSISNQHG